jgi:DNA invertase Pin-like site-specific DNA recombinase
MRRRVTVLVLAGLLALPGAAIAPAFAQDREQTPTDLWKQYPLEETSPQPDAPQPGEDGRPQAGEPKPKAPAAESGNDDGGGSSLLPIIALGVVAAGGTALLLWIVPARRRRKDGAPAEEPVKQPSKARAALAAAVPAEVPAAASRAAARPATLSLAPAAAKATNGAGREGQNGVAPDRPAKVAEPAQGENGTAAREADSEAPATSANGGPVDAPEPPPAPPTDAPATPAAPVLVPEKQTSSQPFRDRELPAAVPEPEGVPSVRALGYTTVPDGDDANSPRLREEARQIQEACQRQGISLSKLVRDRERSSGSDLRRPGLSYALETLESGEFDCLVVPRLDRLTRSAANLGALIRLLDERAARLIVVDIDLDTDTEEGRLAADALVKVGGLERKRLEQRTRKGLEAARDRRRSSGRPAVADRPSLKQRIADMRAGGMTLQAIADTLNDEGIPTVRGGAEWRPSSVQAAAGYKRPSRRSKAGGGTPKK